MKRKISIVLSCLIFSGLLINNTVPVQAVTCSHPSYIDSIESVPKQVLSHNDSVHVMEYGREKICTKCGVHWWSNTFSISEAHQWESMYSEMITNTGSTTFVYDCTARSKGCTRRLYRTVTP